MTRKLFGTDGVRGVAGELLTAELALALGRAATRTDRRSSARRCWSSATRASRARCSGGARRRRQRRRRRRAARRRAADAGGAAADRALRLRPRGVLSASHNPYRGQRHQVLRRRRLQALRRGRAGDRARARAARCRRRRGREPRSGAIRELRGARRGLPARAARALRASSTCAGCDVLLDCANGATYEVAPEIFRRLGASVTVLADAPDGRNINAGCGSTHVDELAARCVRGRTRARLRLRRRRRPRARGRRARRGRRRRRAARARGAAPARATGASAATAWR